MDEIKRMLIFLGLDKHPMADAFWELAVCQTVPKGKKLVGPEEVRPNIIFLVSGLLRGYLVDAGGGEITDCFSFRYGDTRMSVLRSQRSRSEEYVEALEETVTINFPLDQLMPYLLTEPALLNIYIQKMADIYAEQTTHKRMLCHTTAMERYRWFLEEYPGVIDRAPHRHIASFLNITPVTLSRLRREERRKREMGGG